MKTFSLYLLFAVLFVSCEKKDDETPGAGNYAVKGTIQKGPFNEGGAITLHEISDALEIKDKSFTTTVSDDAGAFKVENIEIDNSLVMCRANGYYYHENLGEKSPGTISLEAYADLKELSQVNINVFTHIIAPRIKRLVNEGKSFTEAKEQAEKEFFQAIGLKETPVDDFELLDITKESGSNAALLAFSLSLQSSNYDPGEETFITEDLQSLLSAIRQDFSDNGQINSVSIFHNISQKIEELDFEMSRNLLLSYYEELGISSSIPDIESEISSISNFFTPENYEIKGLVQKGPYLTGTPIEVYELDYNYHQTGRSFSTSIQRHSGFFEVNGVDLYNKIALITANGYYFDENTHSRSKGPLALSAYVDFSSEDFVNINVFNHTTKLRIEKLMNDGLSFEDAQNQAEMELVTTLGFDELQDEIFQNIDLTKDTPGSCMLLAYSVSLQKSAYFSGDPLTAQLAELLADIRVDFKEDGAIEDSTVIQRIVRNLSQLSVSEITFHLQNRYNDIGINGTVPDFAESIRDMEARFNENIYEDFYYPPQATPDPITAPESLIPNILDPELTYNEALPVCFAAYTPLGETLKIEIEFLSGPNTYSYSFDYGWVRSIEGSVYTLISDKENELITGLLHLSSSGSANVRYYEDEDEIPTFTKNIVWE